MFKKGPIKDRRVGDIVHECVSCHRKTRAVIGIVKLNNRIIYLCTNCVGDKLLQLAKQL